jgi:Phage endonuclease I
MGRPWTSNRAAGKAPRLADGFRSGLERKIADDLKSKGQPFEYEKLKINYSIPERKATYTPDFVLLSNGIIVESKGIFDAEDRKKHILIKEQHPELDIRLVFSRANAPIYKGSPTTHKAWAEHHHFKWAEKLIPQAWLNEPPKQ